MNSHLDRIISPLRLDDPALPGRIAAGLLERGVTGDAVREAIPEVAEPKPSMKLNRPEVAARIGMDTALACLLRAFVLPFPTPEAHMREKLGAEFFGLCEEAGLWDRVEDGVVGSVVILEDERVFLLSDHGTNRRGDVEMYWVMNIGTSSVAVSDSIEHRRYERVLDLCCGSGIQGFYVAPLAGRVLALDRNPRALNYGRFGAAMNGFENIEFRESDCYAAVAGEKFDLIACNPPYVMAPDRQTYYRDGGMGGDRFSEKILREAPLHLEEGGMAHITCDVGAMGGQTNEERLRGWLAGNGCDALLVAGMKLTAAQYIKAWLKVEDDAAEEAKRWEEHFRELGVSEIQNWLVVLRKRSSGGENWCRRESLPAKRSGNYGTQVGRIFRAEDLLRQGDSAIWASKLRISPDVRLDRSSRVVKGKWVPEAARLRFDGGMVMEFEVAPDTATLLQHFQNEKSADKALRRIAAEMGRGPEDVRRDLLGYLKHLIGNGVLYAEKG